MFAQTYTKFYVLVILALVLGFIGMEVITSDTAFSGSLTAYATLDATDGMIEEEIAGNWIFLFIGIFVGGAIMASVAYIYATEKKHY